MLTRNAARAEGRGQRAMRRPRSPSWSLRHGAAVAVAGCRTAPPTEQHARLRTGGCHGSAGRAGSRRADPRNAGQRRRPRQAGRPHRPHRYPGHRSRAAARGRGSRSGRRPAAAPAGRIAPEDIRQSQAQLDAAAGDVAAADAELRSAETDLQRFEQLLAEPTPARRNSATMPRRAGMWRGARGGRAGRANRRAREGLARTSAGARPQEIDAARARVASADAQIATLEKAKADATVLAPMAGIVTERLLDPGRNGGAARAGRRVDRSRSRLGRGVRRRAAGAANQARAGGDGFHRCRRNGVAGTVSFISSKAEFTPRNVQTADDRSKLVYRVKITADNRERRAQAGHAGRSGDPPPMTPPAQRPPIPTGARSPAGPRCRSIASARNTATVALRDLSMAVERGEMFGLIGPTAPARPRPSG